MGRNMRYVFLLIILTGCSSSSLTDSSNLKTLNVADAALQSGNPSLALKVSQNYLKAHPGDLDARLYEAQALYVLKREATACEMYEQLYADNHSFATTEGFARCLVKKEPSKAIKLLQAAVAKSPGDTKIMVNLGVAEDFLGDHRAARVAYQKAIYMDPLNISAQVNFALSLALSGEGKRAADLLQPLAEGPDSNEQIRQNYGAALAIAGRTNEAISVLETDIPASQARAAASAYQTLASYSGPSSGP